MERLLTSRCSSARRAVGEGGPELSRDSNARGMVVSSGVGICPSLDQTLWRGMVRKRLGELQLDCIYASRAGAMVHRESGMWVEIELGD